MLFILKYQEINTMENCCQEATLYALNANLVELVTVAPLILLFINR